MTITEHLIESQREALLELGFRQRHGFLYEIVVDGGRLVSYSVGSDGAWTVCSEPLGRRATESYDRFVLSPGLPLRTFVAVVESLL